MYCATNASFFLTFQKAFVYIAHVIVYPIGQLFTGYLISAVPFYINVGSIKYQTTPTVINFYINRIDKSVGEGPQHIVFRIVIGCKYIRNCIQRTIINTYFVCFAAFVPVAVYPGYCVTAGY